MTQLSTMVRSKRGSLERLCCHWTISSTTRPDRARSGFAQCSSLKASADSAASARRSFTTFFGLAAVLERNGTGRSAADARVSFDSVFADDALGGRRSNPTERGPRFGYTLRPKVTGSNEYRCAKLNRHAAAEIGAVCPMSGRWLPTEACNEGAERSRHNANTRLGRACIPVARAYPGQSGIAALPDGRAAFAARVSLADAADRTLDVRYYIWRNDMSGTLLFAALHRAADRGVRVRLLLDDNGTVGLDAVLAVLDAHPNIEVRLFNPFKLRRWRVLEYLTDFPRLNRRMHNKSFTADDHATIIGGRNVGDEYFDAGQATFFVDLDVLAIGPVVNEVSRDFERYWTSASAIPARRVLRRATARSQADVAAAAARVERQPAAIAYREAVARTSFMRDLLGGRLIFEWTTTRMLSDDPAKGLDRVPEAALVWHHLRDALGSSTQTVRLVSPYFVPGTAGVKGLAALVEKGVNITVLTNSLEATDVTVVHSGYAKRRRSLLRAGVALFELKRASSQPPVKRAGQIRSLGSGSSASSLHAKTFAVDGERVFIGSFNFDPRSARLNTEMGFLIDSSALADAIARRFANEVPARAYHVRLNEAGKLCWIDWRQGEEIVHTSEPGATLMRRFVLSLLSLMPIEWLL